MHEKSTLILKTLYMYKYTETCRDSYKKDNHINYEGNSKIVIKYPEMYYIYTNQAFAIIFQHMKY